ncbi:sensor histidine kinase [Pontibacter ramchanderi]|uniref:histidine kinase n=1 Tax=Pontibacter ramchanderi TaxID=1179743 RepID=A0A2N3U9W7_9BACT|nr:HAMP domain-containing sensor histidine kinase [Pontibacter ramchanderi]PKV63532.1 signal transduction histidine kinase [Pontibacter ramchanderi]
MRLQHWLIVLFTGLMALILLGINLVMYSMSSGYRQHNFFLSLENSSSVVASAVLQQEKAEDYYAVKNSILQHLADEEEYIIRINKERSQITFPPSLPLEESFYWEAISNGRARRYENGVHYVGLFREDIDGTDDILVISSARDVEGDAYRKRLKTTLVIAFLSGVLLMTLTTVFFSKRLFGSMVKIIKKVNSINAFNLNDRLEKEHSLDEISDLQDTLNEMLQRIETAFKSQQAYVSNISHSLRTPLTVIVGEAEIALSHLEQGHPAAYSLRMVMQETEKLKHIINTLLELAKSERQEQGQGWGVHRLDEIVEVVQEMVGKMDKSYKLRMDYNKFPENEAMLYVYCNEALLTLAISNIILNGFKYSDNQQVMLKIMADGGKVKLQIMDSGIGIPAAELDKIFDPYFRASNTANYEGFGIGLPLAMKILERHKGTIQVSSRVGKGTTIDVVLPAVHAVQGT